MEEVKIAGLAELLSGGEIGNPGRGASALRGEAPQSK
jgi:hypothetical protein